MHNYKKIFDKTEEFEYSGLYLYGSGEMDQLCLLKKNPQSDESLLEAKYITKVNCKFLNDKEKIKTITCGTYCTMILSTNGNVYTFGCADNWGLGHIESTTNLKVELTFKATGISSGDCHGIAYNKKNLAVWGQFRNSNGPLGLPFKNPYYYNNSNIENNNFKKVISAKNHVIILTEEKNIFAFGNYEYGQTGLCPRNNHDFLLINKINEQNVEDIFTGDQHSFLIKYENNIKILKSWGLNNCGQLGIGGSFINDNDANVSIYVPTKVEFPFIDNISVEKVSGGSESSICLSDTNRVFVWGNNQDNLLGLNDEKSKIISRPREILFFNSELYPNNEIDEIYASAQFFYAKNNYDNKVYSWGCGDSFVLGNKTENSEETPFEIHPLFFKNVIVSQIALGYSHVAVLLKDEGKQKINPEFKITNLIQSEPIYYNGFDVVKRKNYKLEYESEPEDYIKKTNKGVDSVVKEEYITLNFEDLPKQMNISNNIINSNSKAKSKKKSEKESSGKSKKDISEKVSEKRSFKKKNETSLQKKINETVIIEEKERYIYPKKKPESEPKSKQKPKSIKKTRRKNNIDTNCSNSSKKPENREEIINTQIKGSSSKTKIIDKNISNSRNKRKVRSTINLENEEEKMQQTPSSKKKKMKKEDSVGKEKLLRMSIKRYPPSIRKSQRSNKSKRSRSNKKKIKEQEEKEDENYKNNKKDEKNNKKEEKKEKSKNSKSKNRKSKRRK